MTAEFLRNGKIQADRFGVADMQIAVGFGREARHHLFGAASVEVGLDDVADEVAPGLRAASPLGLSTFAIRPRIR